VAERCSGHSDGEIHTRTVPVSAIRVPDGRRRIDSDHVAALVASMRDSGQLTPIRIGKDRTLIFGAHRLEAALALGWTTIRAEVVDSNEAQRAMAELDENISKPLPSAERSRLLAELKATRIASDPSLGRGGRRASAGAPRSEEPAPTTGAERKRGRRAGHNQTANLAIAGQPEEQEAEPFVTELAAKTGRSERSIRGDIYIGERLTEEAREAVRGTKVENTTAALRRIVDAGYGAAEQVAQAALEIEKAESPKRKPVDDKEESPPHSPSEPVEKKEHWRHVESVKLDESIMELLTKQNLTPKEVAKRLGISRSAVQASKARNGLAKKVRRDPIARLGETAREFADSLGDLMAVAERSLASASKDQVASVVEALTELEAKARELKTRLKKEAGRGEKA
jgi:predicted transcriptional regulator